MGVSWALLYIETWGPTNSPPFLAGVLGGGQRLARKGDGGGPGRDPRGILGADLARSAMGGGVGRGSPRGWARSGVGADPTCNVPGFFVYGRRDPPFSTLWDLLGDPACPTTPRHDCFGGVADPQIRTLRVPRVVQVICDGVFRVPSQTF